MGSNLQMPNSAIRLAGVKKRQTTTGGRWLLAGPLLDGDYHNRKN